MQRRTLSLLRVPFPVPRTVSANLDCSYEEDMLSKISSLTAKAYKTLQELEKALNGVNKVTDITKRSVYYKEKILRTMSILRTATDALEELVSADYWPFPTYGDLLFGV